MRKFLAILIGATALTSPVLARDVATDMPREARERAPQVQLADRGFGDRFREMRQSRQERPQTQQSSAPAPQPQAARPERSNWGGGDFGRQRGEGRRSEAPPVMAPAPTPRVADRGDRGGQSGGNWRGHRGGNMTTGQAPQPRSDGGNRNWDGARDRDYSRSRDEHRNVERRRGENRRPDRNADYARVWDRDRNNNGHSNRDRSHDRGQDWGYRNNHGSHNGNWGNNNDGNWNNSWRNDRRYNWNDYRTRYGHYYRQPRYANPYGYNYGYRRFSIGIYLDSPFYGDNYWISDPYQYRLPPAYGPYRWVRYYDDVMLVDLRNGRVVDVIHDFFW